MIWGAEDRVLSDLPGAILAAERIRRVRQVVIPKCGHAPQIERAGLVNRLISQFLRDKLKSIPPDVSPYRYLGRGAEPVFAGSSPEAPAHFAHRRPSAFRRNRVELP